MKTLIFAATFLAIGFVVPQASVAQMTGHNAQSHAFHRQGTGEPPESLLVEPGQGAFAAISEIVRVLEADPTTDWPRVNITALRDHLIDMDRVIRDTVVAQEALTDGIHAIVTGDAEALAAAARMVPAHAAELRRDDRWQVETAVTSNSVELTVVSDDPVVATRIKALGFYGLMASQDHHRAHHYIIATGGVAHAKH